MGPGSHGARSGGVRGDYLGVIAPVTVIPEVARVLKTIEARWVAEGFPDEARVRDLLGEELSGV